MPRGQLSFDPGEMARSAIMAMTRSRARQVTQNAQRFMLDQAVFSKRASHVIPLVRPVITRLLNFHDMNFVWPGLSLAGFVAARFSAIWSNGEHLTPWLRRTTTKLDPYTS